MRAGARIEVDDRKHNPLDFALWKESKPDEPSWPSPWGAGRPGWHIECSAMIEKYLGTEFDIHGGGHDLVFPHHENEIAQAAGLGRKFARYWMHNGFVRVDNEKMSKSLNNFFTIKEVLAHFHPEIVRFFLLSKHYRSPIDFSQEGLLETKRSLDRAYRALQGAADRGVEPERDGASPETAEIKERFLAAMNDDLNTARAIGNLFEGIKELNRLLDEARDGKTNPDSIKAWTSTIVHMGDILGILNRPPAEWFGRRAATDQDQPAEALSTEKIEALIEQRSKARSDKNWPEADRIRDELKAMGVVLEDVGGETRWRFE
jgi:cysteinyl-tRNA synthetase